MRIAILTPSRSRPEGLLRLFESINYTMSGDNSIDLIAGIDKDDPEIEKYHKVSSIIKGNAKNKLNFSMIVKERMPLAKLWNSLIKYSTADYFMCGNDDYVFQSHLWDRIFISKIKDHPYYMYFFDDGLQHGNHASFPILSKEWVNTLGYYFPEIFIHNYVDTWVNDIARMLNVRVYIPEVICQHLHYSIGLSEYDQTYIDGMADNSNEKDKKLYNETIQERIRCAELLKTKICQHQHYSH